MSKETRDGLTIFLLGWGAGIMTWYLADLLVEGLK